jgi:hypothetical protein
MSRGSLASRTQRPRRPQRPVFFALFAIFAFLLAAAPRPFAAAVLPHLRGIEEVRDWFNANKGHVRLILLLSPT